MMFWAEVSFAILIAGCVLGLVLHGLFDQLFWLFRLFRDSRYRRRGLQGSQRNDAEDDTIPFKLSCARCEVAGELKTCCLCNWLFCIACRTEAGVYSICSQCDRSDKTSPAQ